MDFISINELHQQANIDHLEDRLQELRVEYMKKALINKNELITELVCDFNNYTATRSLGYSTLLDNLPFDLRNYGSIRQEELQHLFNTQQLEVNF